MVRDPVEPELVDIFDDCNACCRQQNQPRWEGRVETVEPTQLFGGGVDVGGGGLGDLAIRYGYQRFNVSVMLATVLILVIIVQLLQMAGDRLARHFLHSWRLAFLGDIHAYPQYFRFIANTGCL